MTTGGADAVQTPVHAAYQAPMMIKLSAFALALLVLSCQLRILLHLTDRRRQRRF